MAEGTPSLEEWRALYDAAICFRDLSPWTWFCEDDLFGVANPEDGEVGYCSIMGELGEHLALAVYRGAEGFSSYLRLRDAGPEHPDFLEIFFQQSSLQASFESRDLLNEEDRQVIRSLGLRFRGRQAWPVFRDFTPEYFPWHLTAPQTRFLTVALEQSIEVTTRFRDNPKALYRDEGWTCLVRVSRPGKRGRIWKDEWRPFPEEEPLPVPVPRFDEGELEKLRLKASTVEHKGAWELDYYCSQAAARERKGDRPFYPLVVLVVYHGSGFILASDLAAAGRLGETLGGTLQRLLSELPTWPQQIRVRRTDLFAMLLPVGQLLGIEIVPMDTLPDLAQARKAMERIFTR